MKTISPTKASNFRSCAQRFKYKYVDGMTEPVSDAARTGTLVHAVLEQLMKLPADDRTFDNADEMVPRLATPEVHGDFEGITEPEIVVARSMVANYFALEDPRKVKPRSLEEKLDVPYQEIQLRGKIDRVDEDGSVTDYKTGREPTERYENKAFWGLRFYAATLFVRDGVIPPRIVLLFLKEGTRMVIEPNQQLVDATLKQIVAYDRAIGRARSRDDFRAQPSALCAYCAFVNICPAWAGSQP